MGNTRKERVLKTTKNVIRSRYDGIKIWIDADENN